MDINLTGVGVYNGTSQQVDPTHHAARTSLRPPEKGVFGGYRIGMFSGVVAAGMTGPLAIWEWRWPSTSVNALVRRLRFRAFTDTTAFAQGSCIFSLFKATKFTVVDATGAQTAPTLIGKDNVKSSRFAQSQCQSTINGQANQCFAILNTANTGLTGGTKTLDSNPLAVMGGSVGANPSVNIVDGYFIDPCEAAREPEELFANEGLVIRAELVAATGTWKFIVEPEWDEVDPARYF